jgi:hypothetical protein
LNQFSVSTITAKRVVVVGKEHSLLRLGLQSIVKELRTEAFAAFQDLLSGPVSTRVYFPQYVPDWSIRITGSGRPADVADQLLRSATAARYLTRGEVTAITGTEGKGWQLSIASLRYPHAADTMMVALAEAAWC